jgi:hypothetical protein
MSDIWPPLESVRRSGLESSPVPCGVTSRVSGKIMRLATLFGGPRTMLGGRGSRLVDRSPAAKRAPAPEMLTKCVGAAAAAAAGTGQSAVFNISRNRCHLACMRPGRQADGCEEHETTRCVVPG